MDKICNICQFIHFKIMKHYDIVAGKNWYRHKLAEVIIKPKCEIIYNQVIATARPVGANRPDIIYIVIDIMMIDVSCPFTSRS